MPTVTIDFDIDELSVPLTVTVSKDDIDQFLFDDLDPEPNDKLPEKGVSKPLRAISDDAA